MRIPDLLGGEQSLCAAEGERLSGLIEKHSTHQGPNQLRRTVPRAPNRQHKCAVALLPPSNLTDTLNSMLPTLTPLAHFVSKPCRQTAMKEKTGPETKLQLLTQMAQVRRERRDQTKKGKKERSGDQRWRGAECRAEIQLSESNISGGKNWGVGNINQSVHLVGSHMADQHANSANLLIFSNGVQLIPLAAFISTSHTERREAEKEKKRVCYDSLLFHRILSRL